MTQGSRNDPGRNLKQIRERRVQPEVTGERVAWPVQADWTEPEYREWVHREVIPLGRRDPLAGYHFADTLPEMVRESTFPYGIQKGHTLEDYLALPEDRRVEMIDGVFYDMAAPTTVHQLLGGFIHHKLMGHVLENGGKCMPFISPVDVQLDEDERTMVQPDVLIVCDLNRLKNFRVFGAPEFLVEVLSPSTRKKDMQLKLYKYRRAGVQEYWMIDPEKETIVVLTQEHWDAPVIYGLKDTVPVGIWDGACKVDFSEIWDKFELLMRTAHLR